jgi:hypothetical protein
MLAMYPNRIPVIVEMSTSSASYTTYIEASHKIKYLVPYDICLGQLIKIIRDKIKLDKTKGLFFFIQNKLLPPSSIIGEIYKELMENNKLDETTSRLIKEFIDKINQDENYKSQQNLNRPA